MASLLSLLALGAVLVSCESRETDPAGKALDPGASRATPVAQEVAAPRSTPTAPEATRVVLLGSGTPIPDPYRSGPAVVVLAKGRPYLVDFGPGVVRRATLAQQRGLRALDIRKLTRVFVTHLHSDHTAGYPDLILTPAVVGRVDPLQVYGPPGIEHMTKRLQEAYREDFEMRRAQRDHQETRAYIVETHEVEPGLVYQDDEVEVNAFAVKHGAWKHAYGYRFETPDRTIVISGDTAPTDAVVEACNGCDVLLHEVYCKAGLDQGPDIWRGYHSSHHTSNVELVRIAERAHPKLLILYHVLFMGCTDEQLLSEVRRRYRGQVALGRDLGVY